MNGEFANLLDSPERFGGELHRNIPSIRTSQSVFDDLSDDTAAQSLAIEIEQKSKGLPAPAEAIITRPFDYSALQFPFERENWSQTRFSDGSFGVFYGSVELETTLHETLYHWIDFLNASEGFLDDGPIRTDRRVHLVEVDAILFNCVEKIAEYPDLVHPHDYSFTNRIGIHLHQEDRDGLLTQSARCDGVNAPILRRDRQLKSQVLCYLTYDVIPKDRSISVRRTRKEELLNVSWDEAYFRYL